MYQSYKVDQISSHTCLINGFDLQNKKKYDDFYKNLFNIWNSSQAQKASSKDELKNSNKWNK